MKIRKLEITQVPVYSEKIGKSFDGFRLAVLADLHDCLLGENQELLLEALRRQAPEAVLIAGDLITEEKKRGGVHWRNALALMRELCRRYRVYYALGNHERRWQAADLPGRPSFSRWRRKLENLGAVVLDNTSLWLHRGEDRIRLTGLNLPLQYYARLELHPIPRRTSPHLSLQELNRLVGKADPEHFQILLAHTPEYAETYGAWGADLALAGHFHGGIIRLPLVGGLISTSFRLFPRYDRGRFPIGRGELVVSAGLGTHTIPLRLFNPPELVMITLYGGNAGGADGIT